MELKELLPVYKKQEPGSYDFRFTVFTPVFNCEDTIGRVHDSLANQTYKDFEWLIINDGSTDNSHEVIENIIKDSPLTINYVNNPKNQHKMGCFIQGVGLAKGALFLTFDGDDECKPNSLQTFEDLYDAVPTDMRSTVGAVTVLCEDQNGEPVGKPFPKDEFYCNTFKAKILKQISGEKWGFTKTDVLRSMVVDPNIFSKGLIPESLIWNLVAKAGYLTKCVNTTLRIYHTDVEGSLSSSSLKSTAFGTCLISLSHINWFLKDLFFTAPTYFLKSLYFFLRATNHLEYGLRDYLRSMDSFLAKCVFTLLWPLRKLMK